MTEAEKAYQYFVIAVPENEEQAKAYFWARKALQPTLITPNEFAARTLELYELYTKIQAITGFTVEQLLDMFLAGYTLKPPDYSTNLKELASIAENTPPNEPLTIEQLRQLKDEPVYLKVFDPLLESGWHIIKAVTESKIIFRGWQTVYVPIDGMGLDYNLYRRPPEGEVDGE